MSSLFTGVLVLAGLSALLALLLEAADAYLSDYGEISLNINQGEKRLKLKGGETLLAALMDRGVFIPSACGGKASCGLCKVRVISGAGPVLPTERPFLSPAEIKEGLRLACQVKLRQDMEVSIPSAFFNIREFKCRVAKLSNLTQSMKKVVLDLVEPGEISFKPGQFIQLQVPAYPGSPQPVQRAYSIASPAYEKRRVTLFITHVPDGLASTYVHRHLKPGDEIFFNGPYGDFFLRDSDREMIMIATGSGLAPLISILHQLAKAKSRRKATLLFGARTSNDLICLAKIASLQKRLTNFSFVPVLSAPQPDEGWKGKTGLVTQGLETLLKPDMEAYLCGNPLMINAAVKLLSSGGIPEERIFYDKFA